MATLQDIAQEANVSSSAVSMVLNNRVGISLETRERVKKAMRKLQYRRVGSGRPLKGGQFYNLAIIYDQWVVQNGHVNPLAASWISSIHRTAAQAGHNVSIFVGKPYETEQVFQEFLTNSGLDGAILIGSSADHAHYKALATSELPIVVMNRRPRHDEFSYVAIDNYGGARSAVEHFYTLGHRRIAHLCDTLEQSFRIDRSEGFNEAMARRELTPARTITVEVGASDEVIARSCKSIIDSGATAVFINATINVPACLDAWERMGISIPRQLSVIDFDDQDIRSASGLRTTSVGYSNELMGASAMELLLKILERGNEIRRRSLVVPARVVEHDTTGSMGGGRNNHK